MLAKAGRDGGDRGRTLSLVASGGSGVLPGRGGRVARTGAEMVAAVLLLAVAAVLAVRAVRRDRRRGAEVAMFARSHGLEYSRTDTSGLLGLPFPLLRRGARRGCQNVITGRWRGLAVRYADYWYLAPAAAEGGRSGGAALARLSVVAAGLGIQAPNLAVSRRDPLARLAGHFGVPEVDVGPGGFSSQYRVTSPDPGFARTLIDPAMMAWLSSAGPHLRFEVAGGWLIAWCELLGPTALPSLLDAAAGFAARIPRAVFDGYPAPVTPQP